MQPTCKPTERLSQGTTLLRRGPYEGRQQPACQLAPSLEIQSTLHRLSEAAAQQTAARSVALSWLTRLSHNHPIYALSSGLQHRSPTW